MLVRDAACQAGVSPDVYIGLQLEVLHAIRGKDLDQLDANLAELPVRLAEDPAMRRWQRHIASATPGRRFDDELPEVVLAERLTDGLELTRSLLTKLVALDWARTRALELAAVGRGLTIDETASLLAN